MRLHHGIALAGFSLTLTTGCFEDVPKADSGTDASETVGDGDGDPTGDGDGDGDGDPTGDGDGDGDGDPTGTEECEASEVCVEDAIPGWEGPLAIYQGTDGDTPPACQGNTPVKIAEVFAGLQTNETDETCGCACSPLQGATCGAATLIQSSTIGCVNLLDSWQVGPDQCLDLGGVQSSVRYSAVAPDLVGGSCTPELLEPIPSANFDTQILACALDAAAPACGDGGVCMVPPEAPFEASICIATEGDVQCPSGAYAERFVYHTGFEDSRECGQCSCELAPGTKCSGDVRLLGNSCGVQGLLLGTVALGGCSNSIANVEFADFAPDPVQEGTCSPSAAQIEGGVEALGAWTFCCQ
jgi:hypothetical protein